jgi:flagellar biosynthesis protein FlhF
MKKMEQFTVVARSEDECLAKVRKDFGDGVVRILSSEPVPNRGMDWLLRPGRIEYRGCITPHPDLTKYAASVVMGRELAMGKNVPVPAEAAPRAQADTEHGRRPSLSEELMGRLLEEMAQLKKVVAMGAGSASTASSAPLPVPTEHKTIGLVREALGGNGFSAAYTGNMVGRLRREFSVASLDDAAGVLQRVREWIGGDIQFYDENREQTAKPRIFVLIGPTGVGKTTTMAKIAFAYTRPEKMNAGKTDKSRMVGRYKQKAALLSIDRYRIGAGEEIKKYGELLGIPYQNIYNEEELQKELMFYRENADIILVDTFGNNPYEAVRLAKMKELLDVCGEDAEYHLALSATTRDEDITDILRAFDLFNYRSVVLTKLDETRKLGGIISCLAEKGKKVSFVTTGQDVPYDIERGNAEHFLAKLTGIRSTA